MHDLRWVRENPDEFDRGLARRGLPPRADEVLALDQNARAAETKLQEAQAERNRLGKEIALAKRRGETELRQDIREAMVEVQAKDLSKLASEAASLGELLKRLLESLPNLPADDVPDGLDESTNRELRRHGELPRFDFAPLPHEAIGEKLGLMDFATAARLSGARFVVLRGALARLERAIAQFMLDLHAGEFGYTEIAPPYLVRDDVVFGTGQLPKAAEDMFQTREGLWLIPTAEVPLTNLVAGEILDEATLPRRYVAWTPCFRAEAGAAGRDTRGMIRQHQFAKVELVSITRPDDSAAEHERMTNCAEEVLRRLGLAYRVMLLSAGDMGFSARKTYDIEVWLPAQNTYREISSCSDCGPFQAQRMKARYRPAEGKGTRSVHTLNGSALAVGRTMVAILENFQRADGSVAIPEALHPYMGGLTVLTPNG
ncbi:MAG TPA: serine--tRNA ligase [Stellaceae bacterium]|jgi:seryl-tRNA synthetase|nr:serine--tRNA ligase [Stellaceae bacterium]